MYVRTIPCGEWHYGRGGGTLRRVLCLNGEVSPGTGEVSPGTGKVSPGIMYEASSLSRNLLENEWRRPLDSDRPEIVLFSMVPFLETGGVVLKEFFV